MTASCAVCTSVTTGMWNVSRTFAKDFQRLFVADSCERVKPAPVRLPVAPFEDIGYVEAGGLLKKSSGDVECHLFTLDHARTCKQKVVARST